MSENSPASVDRSDRLVSIWIQVDMLLQAYRTIFVTSAAVLLGLAGSVATSQPRLAWWLLAAAAPIVFIWMWWCHKTAAKESYLQLLVLQHEETGRPVHNPLTQFVRFESDSGFRKQFAEKNPHYRKMVNSAVRIWIDRVIPIVFVVAAGAITVYTIFPELFSPSAPVHAQTSQSADTPQRR